MSSLISSSASGADIHVCTTRLPVPPHGVGVVIDGSKTVLINNLAACRLGDTILEAVGPPDKIAKGEMTVIHFSRRNSQVELCAAGQVPAEVDYSALRSHRSFFCLTGT